MCVFMQSRKHKRSKIEENHRGHYHKIDSVKMATLSNASARSSLVLRILSLLLLLASVIVMATCTIPDLIDGFNDRFTVLFTYR